MNPTLIFKNITTYISEYRKEMQKIRNEIHTLETNVDARTSGKKIEEIRKDIEQKRV